MRFRQHSHPVVVHCFTRAVIEQARRDKVDCYIYEDGFYDPIDAKVHFRRGVFTWHSPARAVRINGRTYGAAADLNFRVLGRGWSSTPWADEGDYVRRRVFPLAVQFRVACRWEIHHAHADAGSDTRFGGRAVDVPLHGTNYVRLGGPVWATTRCLAIDGQPGPNTWAAVQTVVGVTPDGDPGPITWAALRTHFKASSDKAAQLAWASRVQSGPYGRTSFWRNVQIRFDLHGKL